MRLHYCWFMNSKTRMLFEDLEYFDINTYKETEKLPFSIKILLENLIRNSAQESDIKATLDYKQNAGIYTIDYQPGRVLMQDFTGVPAIVDLASLRDAVLKNGKDPNQVNPQIPVDLVIDHSIQVDKFATDDSQYFNEKLVSHSVIYIFSSHSVRPSPFILVS